MSTEDEEGEQKSRLRLGGEAKKRGSGERRNAGGTASIQLSRSAAAAATIEHLYMVANI